MTAVDRDNRTERECVMNDDFGKLAVVHTAKEEWQASPIPGVWR